MTTDRTLEIETDTALAGLYATLGGIEHRRSSAERTIARITSGYATTDGPAFDPDTLGYAARGNYDRALEAAAEADQAAAANYLERIPLNATYTAAGRWSRFFLVTNPGGHIHATMLCSTCRPTTELAWLPELSALTEADAVAAHGGILCSVCFSTAPVEWTDGESLEAVAKRETKADAKAERAAKKLAKALLPDGSALVVDGGRAHLATLHAAKMHLTDAAWWGPAHPSFPPADTALVAEAVAAKTGDTVAAVMAAATKRAAKR